jgi:CheY-like chemotaxis protein
MKKYNTILLIDDNEIDNFVAKKIIEKSGFADNVITVQSGRSALNYLETNDTSKNILPDIIVLDLGMPEMDGFEFLLEFEKLNKIIVNNCKVVVLSSSLDIDDYNRANRNKFVRKFINKPLSNNSLMDIDL